MVVECRLEPFCLNVWVEDKRGSVRCEISNHGGTTAPEAGWSSVSCLLQIRFGEWPGKEIDVVNDLHLLTAKASIYLVNMSEKDFIRWGLGARGTLLERRLSDA